MSKTGPKMVKGNRSSMKQLSPDHPIFKRGFAIGVTRSMPSSPAPTSPDTNPSSTPTPETSSNPPQQNDAATPTTTGPKIQKGIGSSMPWAKPDHPIYKRGFAIGVTRSMPSSKSTPATTSTSSSEPQAPSSNPNPSQSNDGEGSTPSRLKVGYRMG